MRKRSAPPSRDRIGITTVAARRRCQPGTLLRARKPSDVGLGSPEAFTAQVESDPELADLIRVALSDDFITALG